MTEDSVSDSQVQDFGSVLIVDDNADIVELLQRTIKAHTRFQTLTAHSGDDALELVKNHRIDVIVLDMLMPGMTGIEFFRTIRNRSMYVPVIFLTGRGDEALKQEALTLGAFDFLEKPTRARDLLILIEAAFQTVCKIRKILTRASA